MTIEDIVFFKMCLLIGGGLQLFIFLIIVYQAQKVKQWNTTTGKVLASELSCFTMETGRVDGAYNVNIKYQYIVKGEKYISKKVYCGDWVALSFSYYMKTIVAQYKIGDECTVYYNTRNPKKSVLKVGICLPVYSVLLCALLFIGIGIYLECI